ncbi:glycosyltransferase family 39 protein [uncultured Agrobacterium sp.]|uniref:glycosyltransferase family 39 protein n=1 Tax=uncultured Agrobacterium sp. TaxID=157277 RepID=UPI00258AEB70|nr:glycosyltransferase family 39 protein [uncultured Agrobacterium sp.]
MTMSKCLTEKMSGNTTRSVYRRLSECLLGNPNAVVALFGLYYIIQIFVRLAMPPALRIDEAQQVLFAQWLALGYDAQPPLYNWYQQIVFSLFGTSMATIAIAKNFILFLTFAVYIKLADLVLKDKRFVLISALALFLSPQVFWQAQRDLTHTAMLMLTCTWLIYLSVRLIQKPTTWGYLLAGVAVGLGMLSKYNFVLILPAVLAAVWFHPNGRERILDRRFLLTIAVSLIVFIPHAIWLFENLQFASEVTLKRMAEAAPDSRMMQIVTGVLRVILGSLVIIAIPALILFASRAKNKSAPIGEAAEAHWMRFFLHYFLALAALLLLVIVTTTMTEVRDRWLLPLVMPFPILAALWFQNGRLDHVKFVAKVLPVCLGIMAFLPIALILSVPVQALVGDSSKSNRDWQSLRHHLHDEKGISPSLVVTPDWLTGGNIRFIFPETTVATVIYDDFDPSFQPSFDHPILFVSSGDGDTDKMTAWLEGQIGVKLKNVTVNSFSSPMYYPIEGRMQNYTYSLITPDNFEGTPRQP